MVAQTTVRWPRLLGLIGLCAGAGALGAVFTNQGVTEWYPTLKKPSFTPPSSVFGPVWTTLYLLMGIAAYLVAQEADTHPRYQEIAQRARTLFALQLGLNVGWSFLFFTLRLPFVALVELIALWIAIALTIQTFARISRVAALLLVPYLLWTTFAAALNGTIWWLNRE